MSTAHKFNRRGEKQISAPVGQSRGATDAEYSHVQGEKPPDRRATPARLPGANRFGFLRLPEPRMRRPEFITLNERLCSGPHSITRVPDDKLHHPARLPDLEGCLINQRLDADAISRGGNGDRFCPGHILTPTHHYSAISPARSP